MNQKMKAIVWDGNDYPHSLSYIDFDRPKPVPGWVLVYNKSCGICGSDLHYLLGGDKSLIPKENFPAVLGHENAGVVVEVGQEVENVKPGDRVAIEPLHGCREFGNNCPMCEMGQYHLCSNGLVHIGLPLVRMLPGGYGEYSIAHNTRLFPIPDNVSFEDAALLDILACNVHAVKIARPSMGDSAVVLGCGVIGLDMIQCLRIEGVTDIIAVAKYPFQAQAALEFGAKEVVILDEGISPISEIMNITSGWGVDQAYECVGGETDAMDQAIGMCRKGGTAIMLGIFPPGKRPFDLREIMRKEVNLLTSNSYSTSGFQREYQIALNLLRDGLVDHKSMVTHRFSPEDYLEALNLTISKGKHDSIKTVFCRE